MHPRSCVVCEGRIEKERGLNAAFVSDVYIPEEFKHDIVGCGSCHAYQTDLSSPLFQVNLNAKPDVVEARQHGHIISDSIVSGGNGSNVNNGDDHRNVSRNSRIKSALSNASSASSRYLGVPPLDTRAETKVYESEEAMVDIRRRTQQTLNSMLDKNGVRMALSCTFSPWWW